MSNRKRFGIVCIVACVAILLALWFTGAALALALAGNFCIWTAE